MLNRLPIRSLTGKTPYESWTGNKPNIEHLHVFGCIAHVKVPSVHTNKFDDRSEMMIYLGREPGTKGCRLYNPDNNKIFVSRDVVFEEDRAWMWKNQSDVDYEKQENFFVVTTSTNAAPVQSDEVTPQNIPLADVGENNSETSASNEEGSAESSDGDAHSSTSSTSSAPPRNF